jgi:transcriptional regulator with XRE-family HTH domain
MEEKGLRSSSFADKIQVTRGTISHILDGRNDPSKNTIDKILNTFPDISPSWFLQGEGPMYIRERIVAQPASSFQPDLFDEKKTVDSSEKLQEYEYSQKNEVKKPDVKPYSIVNQVSTQQTIPSKKVNKIIIFYNDETFMTFIPEDK